MHFRLQTDWPYFRTDYNSATAKSRQKTELPWAARRDFDGIGFPPLRSVCCLPGLYRKTCTNLEPIFTLGTQLASQPSVWIHSQHQRPAGFSLAWIHLTCSRTILQTPRPAGSRLIGSSITRIWRRESSTSLTPLWAMSPSYKNNGPIFPRELLSKPVIQPTSRSQATASSLSMARMALYIPEPGTSICRPREHSLPPKVTPFAWLEASPCKSSRRIPSRYSRMARFSRMGMLWASYNWWISPIAASCRSSAPDTFRHPVRRSRRYQLQICRYTRAGSKPQIPDPPKPPRR